MPDFVHLHLHSEYSMLDGLNIINPRHKTHALIEKAKALGMKALAITDHGAMYGALHFYNACRHAGIKPIIGVETYVARQSRFDKQSRPGADQAHLTLLAQNHTGYVNLMKLVSLAHLEGYSYKPRIDLELLFQHAAGVIVLSGCMSSFFNKLLLDKKDEEALTHFKKFKEVFADRFYIELQRNPNIPEQAELNDKLIKIARDLALPLVATNDVHYLEKEDAVAHDAILCVGTRKLITDEKRMKFSSNDYYLKSAEEMAAIWHDYPEVISNTVKLADSCDLQIPTGKLIFPKYPLPAGETVDSFFAKLSQQKMMDKFTGADASYLKTLQARLDYEIKIIQDKGYSAYFLITQDFVNWAKAQGIAVGPGRGSAAGSLVSYVLGITTLNPLEHKLPFERFLNPERPTPPDIDLDFADNRRDEVIDYCAKKYGADQVAHVITFGRMEARVAIRDIGRVLGMPYEEPDKIAKLIPNNPGKKTSLTEAVKVVPELQSYYSQVKYRQLIDLAKKVEGLVRHNSVHAAAIIIADRSLSFYTPIQKDNKSDKMVTQYDMYALDCNVDDDAIGLLKFDFLGLRNLSIMEAAINLIYQTKKVKVDLDNLSLDDKKTYQLLAKGETMGVFQLESAGMRRVAKTLKPNQFSDISALLALYRPGPMELIPQFIEGKLNPKSIKYLDPSLKEIFAETYGVMVYQEQVMQIFEKMAGYSLGEADMIRRAMGKKKKKILDENKKRFVEESSKRGYKPAVAEKVWQYIMAFANYGFNKAHAASYAMISYQTAYLKANFPVEYMAALMSVEAAAGSISAEEKIARAVEVSKKMGIAILPPNINHSDADFVIEGKAIRFGLNAVKNVGVAAIENILATKKRHGQFKSLTEFIYETDSRKVNKRVLESLIKVGAMDEYGTRAAMLENLEKIRQTASQFESAVDGQDNLFANVESAAVALQDSFPQLAEYPRPELLSFEKELLGFYLTEHPMARRLSLVAAKVEKKIADLDLEIHEGQSFLVGGIVQSLRQVTTKKTGKAMAFGTLDDGSSKLTFVVFPKIYEQFTNLLKEGEVLLLKGKVDSREGEIQLMVDKVMANSELAENHAASEMHQELFVPRKTSQAKMQELGKLLKAHPGDQSVAVIVPNGASPQRLLLPYGVNWNDDLQEQIKALLS